MRYVRGWRINFLVHESLFHVVDQPLLVYGLVMRRAKMPVPSIYCAANSTRREHLIGEVDKDEAGEKRRKHVLPFGERPKRLCYNRHLLTVFSDHSFQDFLKGSAAGAKSFN